MPVERLNISNAPHYKISDIPIDKALKQVKSLSGDPLKQTYIKICGEDGLLMVKNNKALLQRHICFELQKRRYKGLSVKHYNALYRLTQEDGAGIQTKIKNTYHAQTGAILTRIWQGIEHQVFVTDTGFEYNQTPYASLSKIAKIITGHERSGPAFFGLKNQGNVS